MSTDYLKRLQTLFDANENYFSKIKERESRLVRIANLKQRIYTQISVYERHTDSNTIRQKSLNERSNFSQKKRKKNNQNVFFAFQRISTRTKSTLFTFSTRTIEVSRSKSSSITVRQIWFSIWIQNLFVNIFNRCLLQDLSKLISFRQTDLITEISRYIYPIIRESKDNYLIANIRLPSIEERGYSSSLSNSVLCSFEFSNKRNLFSSWTWNWTHRSDYLLCTACSSSIENLAFSTSISNGILYLIVDKNLRIFSSHIWVWKHKIKNLIIYSNWSNRYTLSPISGNLSFYYGYYLLNRNIGQVNHW